MPRELTAQLQITVYDDPDDPFNRAVAVSLKRPGHPRESERWTYLLATEVATKDARTDLTAFFSDFMDSV